jgi:TRAP-type mannitol/chloroaromatic compound transport system substrate-binding protein
MIHSLENSSLRAEDLKNEYKEIIRLESKINDYEQKNKSKKINNDIIKEFDLEFTELEQFTSNILDYVNNLDVLIKNLKEIPTYN